MIEIVHIEGDEAEIRVDGRTHFVPYAVQGSTVSFAFDGEIWFVELEEKGRTRARHRDHSMEAPMPGVVLRILVAEGDVVAKGAPLLILEAMKMEHQITAPRDGRIAKIDSFFDVGLAMIAAGLAGPEPTRRWVEGVVTAKAIDRRTVRLRSAEHDGREFSVRDSDVWRAIEVGTMGLAETDAGELIGWRSLEPPRD